MNNESGNNSAKRDENKVEQISRNPSEKAVDSNDNCIRIEHVLPASQSESDRIGRLLLLNKDFRESASQAYNEELSVTNNVEEALKHSGVSQTNSKSQDTESLAYSNFHGTGNGASFSLELLDSSSSSSKIADTKQVKEKSRLYSEVMMSDLSDGISFPEPKRPRTAYIFFVQREHSKIVEDMENQKSCPSSTSTAEDINFHSIEKTLGEKWHNLDLDRKTTYDTLAKEDVERYIHEMNTHEMKASYTRSYLHTMHGGKDFSEAGSSKSETKNRATEESKSPAVFSDNKCSTSDSTAVQKRLHQAKVEEKLNVKVCSWRMMLFIGILLVAAVTSVAFPSQNRQEATTITPRHPSWQCNDNINSLTLREYLIHPDGFHLAMAPAFFGFYAHLGALIALEEMKVGILPSTTGALSHCGKEKLTGNSSTCNIENNNTTATNANNNNLLLKSLSGSSAGAMVAILISSGISPQQAAMFASSMKLADFADPPGIFAAFRGNKFEKIMKKFLMESSSSEHGETTASAKHNYQATSPLSLQNGIIPVAVTAFDLWTLKEQVLTHGCMAKAARASATFPGLFQPVPWTSSTTMTTKRTSILIDGGITDWLGLNGLRVLPGKKKRIVNLVVGSGNSWLIKKALTFFESSSSSFLVSIFIMNTPQCGPWAMSNGEKAVEAARHALTVALDIPMLPGNEEGHYILNVDASFPY